MRNRWRQRGTLWPIERLHDWSRNKLGARGAYEIALAATLFLDRNAEGRVRKLLKFGGNESPDDVADKV